MGKKEVLKDIIDIELVGIVNTINDYTREHFIHSYTKLLLECDYPNDSKKMSYIVDRLLEWYEERLSDIKESQYLHNKHEHYKSIKLLKDLKESL